MRVKTGISGFDNLCEGGLVVNSVNLISGQAGTGKSIFGMEFLYNGVKLGERGLYLSFEENLDDLKKDAMALGWDFDRLEREKKCRFSFVYPFEMGNFQGQLISEVSRISAKRVVIDSTSAFGMALDSQHEVRKQLFNLASQLKRMDCTCLIISEVVDKGYSRFGVEEFIADSVIKLENNGKNRTLQVVKMRRTDHKKGLIPMQITKKGILIGK